MQIDLNSVEFRSDVLTAHHLRAVMVLAQEREKFSEIAVVGEPQALLLDDTHLTIVVPVYCCPLHRVIGDDPFAVILIDRIPCGGWKFRQQCVAQA